MIQDDTWSYRGRCASCDRCPGGGSVLDGHTDHGGGGGTALRRTCVLYVIEEEKCNPLQRLEIGLHSNIAQGYNPNGPLGPCSRPKPH